MTFINKTHSPTLNVIFLKIIEKMKIIIILNYVEIFLSDES